MEVSDVGIVAFAFGRARGERITLSNRKIAEAAKHLARIYSAPIVTQWEVALDLQSFNGPVEVVSEYETGTEYVTTQDVLDRAVEWLAAAGVKNVILVGHPDHVATIRWLIHWHRWRLDSRVKLLSNPLVDSLNRAVPYDRSRMNIQRWTHSRARFWWYLVKLLFGRRHGH